MAVFPELWRAHCPRLPKRRRLFLFLAPRSMTPAIKNAQGLTCRALFCICGLAGLALVGLVYALVLILRSRVSARAARQVVPECPTLDRQSLSLLEVLHFPLS